MYGFHQGRYPPERWMPVKKEDPVIEPIVHGHRTCLLSLGDHPTKIRGRYDSKAEHYVLSIGHVKGQSNLELVLMEKRLCEEPFVQQVDIVAHQSEIVSLSPLIPKHNLVMHQARFVCVLDALEQCIQVI